VLEADRRTGRRDGRAQASYRYRATTSSGGRSSFVDDDAVIISFEPERFVRFNRLRRVCGRFSTSASVSLSGVPPARGRLVFANGRVTPRAVARARSAGFATTVYTVNEPARNGLTWPHSG